MKVDGRIFQQLGGAYRGLTKVPNFGCTGDMSGTKGRAPAVFCWSETQSLPRDL